METTRRKLITLLSSIPALGLLGIGGTKAEEYKEIRGKKHRKVHHEVWTPVDKKGSSITVKPYWDEYAELGEYVELKGHPGLYVYAQENEDITQHERRKYHINKPSIYHISVEADSEFKGGYGWRSPDGSWNDAISPTDGDLCALRYDKKKARWIVIASVSDEEVKANQAVPMWPVVRGVE